MHGYDAKVSKGARESSVVYLGLVISFAGLVLLIWPVGRLGVGTRPDALLVLAGGLTVALIGLILPASDSTARRSESRLDEFVPRWQFSEHHAITVPAPPDRVFEAIRQVRANEIALFGAFTWIRRGGRDIGECVLNAGSRKPILDVALSSGFTLLADDGPREVVIGLAPTEGAFAAMNFAVRPDGAKGSIVTTETRIFAGSPAAKRRFGAYWRLIYPGSALLRRTWLRAIRNRALQRTQSRPEPVPPAAGA